MDDVGKAIVMISQVLLFALACTVSIVLYSAITNSIDSVMLSKDFSNQGDSITGTDEEQKEREATAAEVILAILDLKEKPSGDSVIVDGKTYTYDSSAQKIKRSGGLDWDYGSENLYNGLTSQISGTYKITDYDEDFLEYETY